MHSPLTQPDYPPITDLVTEQAVSSPNRVSITQGPDAITYAMLVERGESVARCLVEAGFGSGDVIGVTGPRGIGFVVALFGVLRCGATVFPLDPELPQRRRRHLVTAGKPKAFVRVGSGNATGDPAASVPSTVVVDARTGRPMAAVPPAGSHPALAPVPSRSPAYLFFTSGTTGAPRGVLGWHGALSHFLLWQRQTFAVDDADRCAQLTGASLT
jgi:non-ribosomal peptide synthetase component F